MPPTGCCCCSSVWSWSEKRLQRSALIRINLAPKETAPTLKINRSIDAMKSYGGFGGRTRAPAGPRSIQMEKDEAANAKITRGENGRVKTPPFPLCLRVPRQRSILLLYRWIYDTTHVARIKQSPLSGGSRTNSFPHAIGPLVKNNITATK